MSDRRVAEGYLAAKLQNFLPLSSTEVGALEALGSSMKPVEPGTILIDEGNEFTAAALIQDGWAMRYRLLRDGRRQIISFLLAGDFCDATAFVRRRSDDAIATITRCSVSWISTGEILRLLEMHPRLGAAFWWAAAHEESILKQHITALGRQSAYQRLAYMFYELWRRHQLLGLASDRSFQCPITQEMLADCLGLTPVHVCRVLRRLRRDGYVNLEGRRACILDAEGLQAEAEISEYAPGSHQAPKQLQRVLDRFTSLDPD